MEFKDVTILDKVGGGKVMSKEFHYVCFRWWLEGESYDMNSQTDALFSTQYSDGVDLLSQHLVRRLERLQEQVEYARDNPGPKADLVVKVVREEMENNLVFAKHAFAIQAGRETVESLVEKKLIQNVY